MRDPADQNSYLPEFLGTVQRPSQSDWLVGAGLRCQPVDTAQCGFLQKSSRLERSVGVQLPEQSSYGTV